MADHRAENIIAAVVTNLTGLATTGANVFRGRAYELNDTELPALCVYLGTDNPRNDGGSSSWQYIDSDLGITVEAVVKSSSAQVDTTLNQIRYEVGQALQADHQQGLDYVITTSEGTATPDLDGQVEKTTGRMRLEYTISYRRSRYVWAVYSASEVESAGTSISITFDSDIVSGTAALGFTATGATIISASYVGDTLTLIVSPVFPGATVTVSYDNSVGNLVGTAGIVASFGPVTVTNSSAFAGVWSQVGSTASWIASTSTKFGASSFSSTDFAYIEDGSDVVACRRFNGSAWVSLGSSFSSLGSIQAPSICNMDGTNFAVVNGASGNAWLRTMAFDGSTWSTVGTPLTISAINTGASLCRLSDTRVVLVEASADVIQAYDWNSGSGTWSAFGSSIAISGNGQVRLTALTSTLIAYADTVANTIALYSLSGTTWSAVSGSTISVGGGSSDSLAICALNATDLVLGKGADNTVRVYRWSGTSWSSIGTTYTVPISIGTGRNDIVSMGGNVVAFLRATTTYNFLVRLAWA